MQGLILAAGRGTRLGASTNSTPKCLLEIGRRPLIEHQLEALAEAGVGPVALIVGYCADEVREVVGIRAEYIDNPRWHATNSLYSFSLARPWVNDSLVVLNCDLLFHPDILNRLLQNGPDCLAYDSSSGQGREHMKVKIYKDRVLDMGKEIPADEASGENVGIVYFSKETADEVFRRSEELLAGDGEKQWLGAAVREVMRGRDIRAVDIAGLPWAEIDFPYDLDRARKEVLPTIQRDRGSLRRAGRWLRWGAALVLAVLFAALSVRAFSPVEQYAWETIALEGLTKATITGSKRRQVWYVIEGGQPARLQVVGPGRVRLESRALLHGERSGPLPYVLEVRLDGKVLDWFKADAAPSGTWKLPGRTLCKRERAVFELADGSHELEIRLVAPEAVEGCLIRLRQRETLAEEE